MEIKNKTAYRAELKKVLTDRIEKFPIFFYGNILLNGAVIMVIILVASVVAVSLRFQPEIAWYGLSVIALLLSILSVLMRNFKKNIRILRVIRAGDYDLEIKDYELDNLIEFFEELPIKKEELERLKTALSFGKLINMLDLFGIIVHTGDMCDMDIIFKHRTMEAIGEDALAGK